MAEVTDYGTGTGDANIGVSFTGNGKYGLNFTTKEVSPGKGFTREQIGEMRQSAYDSNVWHPSKIYFNSGHLKDFSADNDSLTNPSSSEEYKEESSLNSEKDKFLFNLNRDSTEARILNLQVVPPGTPAYNFALPVDKVISEVSKEVPEGEIYRMEVIRPLVDRSGSLSEETSSDIDDDINEIAEVFGASTSNKSCDGDCINCLACEREESIFANSSLFPKDSNEDLTGAYGIVPSGNNNDPSSSNESEFVVGTDNNPTTELI